MGKSVQCCTADPKRVRLAHEKNLEKVGKTGITASASPERNGIKGIRSTSKQNTKVVEVVAPNFDNRYSSMETRPIQSPSFKKQNIEIVSEQEIYEPMKKSIQVKNKRSIKQSSFK